MLDLTTKLRLIPILMLASSPTLFAQDYCQPLFSQQSRPYCRVAFADLEHFEVAEGLHTLGYGEFLSDTAHVVAGNTYTLELRNWSVLGTYTTASRFTVFFDWDQDGDFETYQVISFAEMYLPGCDDDPPIQVTVPSDALLGTTRMRVFRDDFLSAPFADPCTEVYYYNGHAHDYSVHVYQPTTVDCEGVPDGTAMPGTPCTDVDENAGTWNELCECEVDSNPIMTGVADLDPAPAGWLHPNPVRDHLYISTHAPAHAELVVYNAVGNMVLRQTHDSRLEAATLAPGWYVLQLVDQSGRTVARAPFLKE